MFALPWAAPLSGIAHQPLVSKLEDAAETVERSLFRAAINGPNHPFNQQLNSSRWPIYCDHSVTSADVRLSVGKVAP
jgi:hypothetical protein